MNTLYLNITLMWLSIMTPETINFQFVPNGKLMIWFHLPQMEN